MADNPLLKAIQGGSSTDSPLLKALQGKQEQKSTYDPAKQVAGIEARFDAAGLNVDAELDKRNLVEKAFNLPEGQNFFFDFFEVINRPQQALYSAITAGVEGKNIFEGAWKGLSGQEEQVGGDVLEKLGFGDSFLTKTAGFAMDILADPMDLALWSVGAGALSVAADASKAGRLGAKTLNVALDLRKVADEVNEVSKIMKPLSESSEKIVQALAKVGVDAVDELSTNPKGLVGFSNWISKSKGATKVISSRELVFRGTKQLGKYTFTKADQMARFVLGKVDDLRFAKVLDPDAVKAMTSYAEAYGDALHHVKSMFNAVSELGRTATKATLGRLKAAGEKARNLLGMGASASDQMMVHVGKVADDLVARGFFETREEAIPYASRAIANAHEMLLYKPKELMKKFIMPEEIQLKIVTPKRMTTITESLTNNFGTFISKDDITKLFIKNADETFSMDENVLLGIVKNLENRAAGSRALADLTDVLAPAGNKFATLDDFNRAKETLRKQFNATAQEIDSIFYVKGNTFKVNARALEDFIDAKDLPNLPKSIKDITDPKLRRKELRKWRRTMLNEIDKIVNKDKTGFADMIMRESADFGGTKFIDEKTRKQIVAFYRQFGIEISDTGTISKPLGQVEGITNIEKIDTYYGRTSQFDVSPVKTAEQQALPMVTGEAQQIYGKEAIVPLFEKRKLGNGATAYVINEKALKGMWDDMQKIRESLPLEQRLEFDRLLDSEIEAPRFYTKSDLAELKKYGYLENQTLLSDESPLMGAMRYYDEIRKGFSEAVDNDFDTMFGMFDEGYVRHVMTKQAKEAVKQNFLFKNTFAGKLQDFAERKYKMSAYEANLIAREQLKLFTEKGYSAMEAFDNIDDFKLFEEDIMKSFMDFVTEASTEGAKLRRFDTLINSNLLDDPTAFRRVDLRGQPISLGTQIRGFGTVSREELLKKAEGFYNQMKGGDEIFAKLQKKIMEMPDVIAINNAILDQIGMRYQQGASMIAKAMDAINDVFKSTKLWNVGFQVRNLVGNLTNAYLSGMDILEFASPANIKKAYKVMQTGASVMDEVARFGIKSIQANPEKMEIYRMFKMFREAGFDQMGVRMLEYSGQLEEIAKTIGVKIPAKQSKAYQLINISQTLNTKTDSMYRILGLIYGEAHPEFLARYDLIDAQELVRKVFFDPRDLTNFERSTMKRLIPFYTFTKKNLAYQFTNVFDNPKKYSDIMKTFNYAYDLIDLDKDIVEDYKIDNFWLPVYKDKDGNVKMVKLSLPINALSEFTGNPLEQVVSALTPAVRTPFEITANKQMYTGKEIQQFEGQRDYRFPFLSATAGYALSQTGVDVPMSGAMNAFENISSLAQGKGLAGPLLPSIVSQTNEATMRQTQAYNQLEALRGKLKYYKQEGTPLPTMREIENRNATNLNSILERLKSIK